MINSWAGRTHRSEARRSGIPKQATHGLGAPTGAKPGGPGFRSELRYAPSGGTRTARRATCKRVTSRARYWAGAVVLLVTAAFGIAGSAHAYEHKTSTPSFGLQIGYGRLFGNASFSIKNWPGREGRNVAFDLADLHDQYGPSAHVGIRFVLDRNHALGFGFDDIRYKRHEGFSEEERQALPRWVKFTTFHADYYLYFHRRERIGSYLTPIIGIQQRELRFKGSEVAKQEFRLLYGAAGGVEYFVRRSFSVDGAVHVYGLQGGNGTSITVQPALGVHFYVI